VIGIDPIRLFDSNRRPGPLKDGQTQGRVRNTPPLLTLVVMSSPCTTKSQLSLSRISTSNVSVQQPQIKMVRLSFKPKGEARRVGAH
jgi:hypothetical protein